MICSMTAFGSANQTGPAGTATVELRGVNSRFLDVHFRLPDECRHLESALRERLQTVVQRGKIELRVSLQRQAQAAGPHLNPAAMQALAQSFAAVRQWLPDVQPPRLADVLAWPGVQAESAAGLAPWDALVLAATTDALAQFQQARRNEGERLVAVMQAQAQAISSIVTEVEAVMPTLLDDYRARQARKLRDTFEQAFPGGLQHISGAELSERLAHETALFSLRIDVAEELARLRSHVQELHALLQGGAPAAGRSGKTGAGSLGKRLDFVFQEMNREANTLGSKAGAMEMTRAAVDLKLLIEQLREQAQNIE